MIYMIFYNFLLIYPYPFTRFCKIRCNTTLTPNFRHCTVIWTLLLIHLPILTIFGLQKKVKVTSIGNKKGVAVVASIAYTNTIEFSCICRRFWRLCLISLLLYKCQRQKYTAHKRGAKNASENLWLKLRFVCLFVYFFNNIHFSIDCAQNRVWQKNGRQAKSTLNI